MDTNKILDLKFESNNKSIEISRKGPFRLLMIEGIESGELELITTDNTLFDGSTINNKRIKNRAITVEAEYSGENKKKARSELISFFNIHHDGKLTINYMGTELEIDYSLENFKSKINNLNEPLKFLVDLYCPNPYFRDILGHRIDMATWISSFEFPLEILPEGIELGFKEQSLIANIFNDGDVPCGMEVKFKALGILSNPSLFNVNTREYMKINQTMQAGDIITITTHLQNKRVWLDRNGIRTNIFNWWDELGTFLQLETGDNLFRYDADEGIENLDVSIYYTPQYLGV